jgi:hypothetical protein
MVRSLPLACLGLALAACAPPAAKPEPAPLAAAANGWEPADGPGQSALTWRNGKTMITLSCTQKCDVGAKPAPEAPQPLCTKDHATLQVAATAPIGTSLKIGDAATLLIGAAPFAGNLSADDETQPGMAELRVQLDAAAVAAIAGATNARLIIADAEIAGADDDAGQFKQFAQSCAIHAGVKP